MSIPPALLALPPTEFKTAMVMLDVARDGVIRITNSEVAALVGVSERQAQRAIKRVIETGHIVRQTRGIYTTPMSGNTTCMSENTTPMSETATVYMTNSHTYRSLEVPSGTSKGGVAPVRGIEGIELNDYADDDDDLAGFGLTEPRASRIKKKPKVRESLQYHRLKPRSEWTMSYVDKEFRLRVNQMNVAIAEGGLIGGGTGGDSLRRALLEWQSRYGVTPQQAANVVDKFFADPAMTSRIDNRIPAYRLFLDYLKRNIDDERGLTPSEDYYASLGEDDRW